MNPYRTIEKQLIQCKPRRTIWGRIQSWRRKRLINKFGTWRDRNTRCRECKDALSKKEVLFPGEYPLCGSCDLKVNYSKLVNLPGIYRKVADLTY